MTMPDEKCTEELLAEALRHYNNPLFYERAAKPGEDLFRSILVQHARALAAQPAVPATLLTPEEQERLRAAETCPHRDCVGCGCSGCRCLPGGHRAGELVNIRDCLACVTACR